MYGCSLINDEKYNIVYYAITVACFMTIYVLRISV